MGLDEKTAIGEPNAVEFPAVNPNLSTSQDAHTQPNNVPSSWKHLFVFVRWNHALPLVAAVFSSALAGAFRVVLPIILGNVFNTVAESGAGLHNRSDIVSQISAWCLKLVFLGLANWLANAAFLATWIVVGELQAQAVREDTLTSLLTRHMSWFDSLDHGISSLLVRIQTQTRELQLATSQVLGSLISNALISTASIAVALYYSWKLTLVLLATVPVAFLAVSLATRQLRPAIQAQKHHLQTASKLSTASINAIDLVKVFNGFDQELQQYSRAIRTAGKHHLIQARCNAAQMGSIGFFLVVFFLAGFGYGVALVNQGLKPGSVFTTFYAVLSAFQGIEALLPHWLVLSKGMAAGSFLSSITTGSGNDTTTRSSGSLQLEHCVGNVEMQNVSFAYPTSPSKMVLSPSSFSFSAGETTFIVGRSGSGKSTIGNLVARFYEPQTGTIFLDGQPLNAFDAHWIQSHITLIQQSSILFNDTFFNNVALGHANPESATQDDVLDACEFALLQSTLDTLPDGLETTIGTNGHKLSGGQRQRLSLARARLRGPNVLILDEVTSSLDQRNRNLVMDAIRKWRRDKTTIIITHDVDQIRDDDFVYVMEDTLLVQKGFRRDLLQAQGPFSTMASLSLGSTEAPIAEGNADMPGSSTSSSFLPFENGEPAVVDGPRSMREPSRSLKLEKPLPSGMTTDSRHASMTLEQKRAYVSVMADDSLAFDDTIELASLAEDSELPLSTPPRREPVATLGQSHARGVESAVAQTKSQSSTLWTILRTVWPRIRPSERIILVLGLVICIIGAASTAFFSFCFAKLLAAMWSSGDKMAEGKKWIIYLVVVAVIDGLSTFLGYYISERVAQAWVDSIRSEAMKRILRQTKSWFDVEQNAASRISECLERNSEEMRNIVGRFIPIMMFATSVVMISIIWAMVVSWELTLVALAPLPVLFVALKGYTAVSRKWETRCNQGAEEASAMVTEILVNIRVVKALTLETHFAKKYKKLVSRTLGLGLRRAGWTCGLYGLYESMTYPLMAVIFYYASTLLSRKSGPSTAAVIQVVNLLLFSIGNATSLLRSLPQLTMAEATAGQLLAYAELPLDPVGDGSDGKVIAGPLPIQARGLTFAYPQNRDEQVLRGVSLDIRPGTCTAIVGPSGCGKSTLLSLLMGLYPPASTDQLLFAGVPSNQVDMRSLRSKMAYVSQSPFLFPASIAENITYGLPNGSSHRSEANTQDAARAVGLHDFIISLPLGYATLVGEGGVSLSGGQAQRLSIARALVRHPRLLILDEPTSALDAESASAMRETIGALVGQCRGNMAIVLVTHSRDMMRVADNIVVMGGGSKVQEGRYEELVTGGPFKNLIGE